jgi:glycosyltransferase involved in cell wall biosynthesis
LEWKDGLGHFPEDDRCGAVVTTLDRADLLAKCLESISKQFDRILVVDDGSQTTRQRNADVTAYLGAEYVHLGRNRGHACALNTGIAMLLADLDITWISTFEDDTELVTRGVERLKVVTRVLDATDRRNLYSGYRSPNHKSHGEQMIGAERVISCRSCSGQHMHAHRSYWQAVIPIPTTYRRAPKKFGGIFPGQGCDSDWWCSNWAPCSAIKKGGSVWVLPGLVRNNGMGKSTWSGSGR